MIHEQRGGIGTFNKASFCEMIREYRFQSLLSVMVLISCYRVNVNWLTNPLMFILAASGLLLVAEMFFEKARPSIMAWALLLFFGSNLFSTAINGNLILGLLVRFAIAVIYVLWCDLYCRKYTRIFIWSHMIVVGSIFFIQLMFQLFNQGYFGNTKANGLGNYLNFLESDNFLGYYFVPLMVLSILAVVWIRSEFKMAAPVMIFICMASIVASASATGIIGVIFYAVMMVFCFIFLRKWKIPAWLVYLIYFLFFIGIVVFQVQEYVSDILMAVLGKDATLHGRTTIWANVPAVIAQKPWLGYGTMEGNLARVIPVSWGSGYVTAHNYFMDIVVEGGFILLLIYGLILILTAMALKKGKDVLVCNLISMGILAMLIMYTAEGRTLDPAQYLVFVLAYHNDVFSRQPDDLKTLSPEPQQTDPAETAGDISGRNA